MVDLRVNCLPGTTFNNIVRSTSGQFEAHQLLGVRRLTQFDASLATGPIARPVGQITPQSFATPHCI